MLVGAGGLATSLGLALAAAGTPPVAVWSRTREAAEALGTRIGCAAFCDINKLPSADIVIISVADTAVEEVAAAVASRYPAALLAHTAGSISMDVLQRAGASRYGVFYPLQTFSKQRVVDFARLTIFVEGCNEEALSCLENLALRLTPNVQRATSRQRKYLHIAAVFACNFANAAYSMSAELLEKNNLPFEAMLPLIDEVTAKVHKLHPREAQTGPARRGDIAVVEAHKAMLDGRLKDIYTLLSEYIDATTKNENKKL